MTANTVPGGAPAGAPGQPRIVVGVDGSTGARSALRAALLQAARRGAALDVVAVYPMVLGWNGGMPVGIPDLASLRRGTAASARGFLDEVRTELLADDAAGPVDAHVVIAGGPAADMLVRCAGGAGLLVVGSRGRGAVGSVVLGSVALQCVTHAPCPVLVVHEAPPAQPPAGSVVVGFDGSAAATAALREALAQARGLGRDVDVVVARSECELWADVRSTFGPMEDQLRAAEREEARRTVAVVAAEERAAGRPVPPVRVCVVEGPARQVLVREAEDASALVLGSRGHGTLRGLLLGSVALHCAVHARGPVTVVHPEDRPAPAPGAVATAGAQA